MKHKSIDLASEVKRATLPENTIAYVMPEHLDVAANFEADLAAMGYQMKEWRANRPLIFNDRWATRPSGDDVDEIVGRVMDAALTGLEKGRRGRGRASK